MSERNGSGPYRSQVTIASKQKVALLEDEPPAGSTLLLERPGTNSGSESAAPGNAGKPADESTILDFPKIHKSRRRKHIAIAAAVIVALIAGLLAVAIFSPALAVKDVSVSGTKLIPEHQIDEALAPLKGVPLPQVSEADVMDRLRPIAAVEDVTIEAQPPSTLAVQVQERVPVAILKEGDKFVRVDPEGTQLTTAADRSEVSLPIIDGGTAAINRDVFSSITDVLAALPADVLAKMEHASASSVDSVELTLDDGKKVVWGNSSQRELKAQVLAALIGQQQNPDVEPAEVYDVSVPTRPVTR